MLRRRISIISSTNCTTKTASAPLTILLVLAIVCLFINQLQQPVNGYVFGYLNPHEIQLKHSAGLVEPRPWEDGYFDPSYHAWPKNSRMGDKQSVKSTGSGGETALGNRKTERSWVESLFSSLLSPSHITTNSYLLHCASGGSSETKWDRTGAS